jgi:hypothetical protein
MKAVAILFTCLCACELPVNGTGPIPENTPNDAEAPKSEAAALPPNGDQAQLGVCHSWNTSLDGLNRGPCKSYSENDSNVTGHIPYVNAFCQIVAAPDECSTCDYTCDCILRYTTLPDAGCTCSQSATGGVIVISGC